MIEVKPEPMSGNPAAKSMGDKSGLWKVVVYDYGTGGIKDMSTRGRTHSEDHTYEEARELASGLQRQLNPV